MVKFKPGDVITECYPLIHCLNASSIGERCDYCFMKRSGLKKCSKCKSLHYCDAQCQVKDWHNVHKHECKLFSDDLIRSKPLVLGNDCRRLFLRTLLIWKHYPKKMVEPHKTYNGERSFVQLMNHTQDIIAKSPTKLFSAYRMIHDFREMGIIIDEKDFLHLFGQVNTNSFNILDVDLNSIGAGIYVAGSVFDHSCLPNSFPIFDGIKLQIRAVKEFDSEEEPPLFTYTDLKAPKEERQARLLEDYYFVCKCPRCEGSEESSIDLVKLDKKFDDLINAKVWTAAFEIGMTSITHYKEVYPYPSPDLTVQIARAVKIGHMIADSRYVPLLVKLRRDILVTHGEEHSLYRSLIGTNVPLEK
ncbi:N-lysine methyltransferase SMYD2-like isoform X2 [Brevipalpus obovatus]|uniref:N-lysine methyltransferase SMYD2-like isoform X2 n=1 Tax=Brevipalpus obovatus TaxID=246614 RepID=UPI003D9EA713